MKRAGIVFEQEKDCIKMTEIGNVTEEMKRMIVTSELRKKGY